MRKKYMAEGIGTFVMVLAGTGAIVVNDVTGGAITHVGIAITFGLAVTAMIYAVGDVSGAHLNPAVTVGFALAGRLPGRYVWPYILAKLVGAIAASGVLRALFPDQWGLGETHPAGSSFQSFMFEVILTAILMFVILAVSRGPKERGVTAGIAVGAVIALEAMFAGPISGASMNPARSIGPAVVSGDFGSLWIYIIAPMIGSAGGVLMARGALPGEGGDEEESTLG